MKKDNKILVCLVIFVLELDEMGKLDFQEWIKLESQEWIES